MKRVSRKPVVRGFTLIEVMLALAIVASITVIVWGSISTSFTTSERMTRSFDQFQQIRLAVDRMSREFSMSYISAHANRKENLPGLDDELEGLAQIQDEEARNERIEDLQAEAEAARLNGAPPRDNYIETAFVGKSDEVHFTSLAHVRTQPGEKTSDQSEISYFVRTSKRRNQYGSLVRELVRRQDSSPDDDPEKGGVIYTLIDEVEEVEFEFWEEGDEGDEEGGGRWSNRWDSRKSEHRGKLPSRVRITIEVPVPGTNGKSKRTFTTQAPIVMDKILDY